MPASSVVFIGSPPGKGPRGPRKFFAVPISELAFRILAAFVPPVTPRCRRAPVDLLGPLLALLLLLALVARGSGSKRHAPLPPLGTVLSYAALMPLFCHFLARLARSSVRFSETVSMVGYALYGHVFTLAVSFLCFNEQSNFFFFVCLIFFGGLSTLRVAVVFLGTIAAPGARLVVCSLISIVNILSLILIHFLFMHQTYVYRGDKFKL